MYSQSEFDQLSYNIVNTYQIYFWHSFIFSSFSGCLKHSSSVIYFFVELQSIW